MEDLLELTEEERSWLSSEIKNYRRKYINTPKNYLKILEKNNCTDFSYLKSNISKVIEELREGCWQLYLKDEAEFNKNFISHLIETRKLPCSLLQDYIKTYDICNSKNFTTDLSELIGKYTGSIMPYIYALNLSTTQSRRARSGKTFEAIIKYLIVEKFKYPFDDQSNIGQGFFKTQNVGKIVDGIIPNKNAYINNRAKTLIITMKTSLRERWQEVAEEIGRTNTPHMFLLTLDKKLSKQKLKTMELHNIRIVNTKDVKEAYKDYNNIISFDEFFNEEIPDCLNYWERHS
ncbi:type II restriction endonuclease [Candidatus Gastranaerophilales bacterium]|nr:MAG: type II restriction endonuclease [Candidatus Gastranaerophilales bacterium]